MDSIVLGKSSHRSLPPPNFVAPVTLSSFSRFSSSDRDRDRAYDDEHHSSRVMLPSNSILSWQISQGIQSTPESSLVYANDNALVLAKSLRIALLVVFYGSTVLSAFALVGLVLLGRELSSKEK